MICSPTNICTSPREGHLPTCLALLSSLRQGNRAGVCLRRMGPIGHDGRALLLICFVIGPGAFAFGIFSWTKTAGPTLLIRRGQCDATDSFPSTQGRKS